MKLLKHISTSVFILITTLTFSQTNDSSLRELIDLKEYRTDKTAGALIIYDYGEAKFIDNDNGFDMLFHRKFRIKILSEAGLKYAQLGIEVYQEDEKYEYIQNFSAITYNDQNGTIQQTETIKKEMLDEKINDSWNRKKIAIAGVKVGSVIDVDYTISSPFLFNLHDWEFQYDIPVLYSEYKAYMIPFYTYQYICIGISRFDEFQAYTDPGISRRSFGIEYKNQIYKFVKRNIPAFTDDSFISSPSDYKMKIDFQLSKVITTAGVPIDIISTWEEISKKLLKHFSFGKYVKASKGRAKKIIEELDINQLPEEEKLDKLVSYVKQNFNWNGYYDEFAHKNIKEFMNDKSGNVGNINLFLLALLNEAGFEASPVILSTRDHGKIYYDYPFLKFFNYVVVIAKLDGKYILMDACEKNSTFDQIPNWCINDNGLIIQKDSVSWVPLITKKISIEDHNFQLQLNKPKDSLFCRYSYFANSYDAIREKSSYNNAPDDYFNKKAEKFLEDFNLSKLQTEDNTKDFRFELQGSVKANNIENFIIIDPFMNLPITENPFSQKSREYPIDMIYPFQRNFTSKIELPVNSKIIEKPNTVTINSDNFLLSYTIIENENNLIVSCSYQFKKPIYKAEEYQKLQQFMDKVIYAIHQKIKLQHL